MANTISPNMGLIVPGVGTEPGPTWANDLNADLGILDQHNHSNGQGVQITTAGLNINTDLTMNSNNLTHVKTVNFDAQLASLPGLTPNLGCIYVAGNELYYNDESGNVVAITNMGTVNAGAGSITGLPSGTASASYSAGSETFIWQSATSTAANMDNGSVTIREVAANANGITISSPGSLAADYSITLLPTLPVATSFLTIDNSGNLGASSSVASLFPVTTSNIADGAVTLPKIAAPNMVVTTGCGGFFTSSTSFVQVPNFTATLTTTGKPVYISFQADSSGSCETGTTDGTIAAYSIFKDGVQINTNNMTPQGCNMYLPPGFLNYVDPAPTAGSHTYQLMVASTGGVLIFQFAVMVVREM